MLSHHKAVINKLDPTIYFEIKNSTSLVALKEKANKKIVCQSQLEGKKTCMFKGMCVKCNK